MVSAYMRANAQRSAQRAAQQRQAPEITPDDVPPKDSEADKLDFSSEFSTGDMGLNSQGGSAELLAWKREIEEEDEERRRDDDDDEDAQEWAGGGWGQKQPDGDGEPAAEEESPDGPEDDGPDVTIIPAPRNYVPSSVRPVVPNLMPPPAASNPTLPQAPQKTEPTAPKPASPDLESAQSFWGSAPPAAPPTAPAVPSDQAPQPTVPLALDRAQATPPAAYALPERVRPAPQVELPVSGQMAAVDPTLAQLAGKLIANPADQPGYEECVRLLSRFGAGALRMCGREKVRVEILDEADFASHPGLRSLGLSPEEIPSDGAYLIGSRQVLVHRRCLTGRPRFFHPALYYFAHAFDHAQGGETFSSRKAAAVIACYEASTRAYNGFDFVDELAAADPVRYFARSVAVYLGRDDCDDPLWSHQDLFDFDRSMYDYLQYLFARLNG